LIFRYEGMRLDVVYEWCFVCVRVDVFMGCCSDR
jgi:hypothetical protein